MTRLVPLVLISAVLSACKKDYTCSCSNPGGVFQTYRITGTKRKAVQKCDAYAKQHQTVAFSETSCSIK